MAFLALKSLQRREARSKRSSKARSIGRWLIAQENIALCKKLLADHNITDGQRDVIGKILAEEEAKLLDLFSLSARTGNVTPIAPYLLAQRK